MSPAAVFDLHLARSAFIDAYNLVDQAVRARLRPLGQPALALTGHNLDALAKIPASPKYSKTQKEKTVELMRQMRELQAIRCDVVHSRMQTIETPGGTVAYFANVQETSGIGRRCLILTKAELQLCEKRFKEIADALNQLSQAPAKTTAASS